MQDCGQPPKDLVGDLGSMVTFDDDGNPCLPGLSPGTTDPSQCSVMWCSHIYFVLTSSCVCYMVIIFRDLCHLLNCLLLNCLIHDGFLNE